MVDELKQHELTDDFESAAWKQALTAEQKAVLSAVLQTLKTGGEVNYESLSEAISDSIIGYNSRFVQPSEFMGATVLCEVKDQKGNLDTLTDRHVPAKLRSFKSLSQSAINMANLTAELFQGDWVITKNNEEVRRFDFGVDEYSIAKQVFGTTLYQLITSKFKRIEGNALLDVKARGQRVQPGDCVTLFVILLLLENTTRGKAKTFLLTINFKDFTYNQGDVTDNDLENSEPNLEGDMGEEMDDYDDWER